MEVKNLELYDKYKKPPKEALKDFDNGNFKGTDINTMWRIKCLTEEFGACGFGWYFNIEKLWIEDGGNDEKLAFAEIKLYIKRNGEWSAPISGVGGSKIIQFVKSRSETKSNDEGYKMAITDALGVACKYLGFAAEIYWANDVTKYCNKLIETIKKDESKRAKIRESINKNFPNKKSSDLTEEQARVVLEEVDIEDGVSFKGAK